MWWIVGIVGVVGYVALLVGRNVRARKAAEEWRKREGVGDDVFLSECGIGADDEERRVALGARRVIAELGTVGPETIWAEDPVRDGLSRLPNWDGLDWWDYVFCVEKELNLKVRGRFLGAMRGEMEAGEEVLRVKHVVRATVRCVCGVTGC